MTLAVVMRLRDEIDLLPHIAANLRHADVIFLCDGGSVDGTWEALQELERQDRRVRVSQWPQTLPPFQYQADHLDFAFQRAANERHWDWIHYLDADEIPNVAFQRGIKSWLAGHTFLEQTGIGIRFLYLAPGGQEYYADASQWPMYRLWNYLPHAEHSPGGRSFVLRPQPKTLMETPVSMMILHLNWALRSRFEKKLPEYERHHQQPRWYPDEKYHDRQPLPMQAIWYSPDAGIVRSMELFK